LQSCCSPFCSPIRDFFGEAAEIWVKTRNFDAVRSNSGWLPGGKLSEAAAPSGGLPNPTVGLDAGGEEIVDFMDAIA